MKLSVFAQCRKTSPQGSFTIRQSSKFSVENHFQFAKKQCITLRPVVLDYPLFI